MRCSVAAAVLALSLGVFPAGGAQAQGFEDLVNEALGRDPAPGAPAGQPPASAVPPRLSVDPAPPPAPAAPQAAAPAPIAPAPDALPNAPRPYTPPTLAAPDAPAADAPATATAATPQAPAPAAVAPARFSVAEVNAATFQEGAAGMKGVNPLVLKAQVLLDRAGASPGVIDGIFGGNVAKAIAAVETVLGLPADGRLDPQVWAALGGDQAAPVLIEYTITAEDVAGPFLPVIPADYAEQAQLPSLAYRDPLEMFGERFHMDTDLLRALNPNADFGQAGATIVVAAIEGTPVSGKIARIEADKRQRQLRAFDAENRLVVAYPATIGSSDNPSPSGDHLVNTVASNPVYYYNPKNFVQGDNTEPLELPPGPNNPVGTMWIDLSEPSYGIHGTPEPSRIDKTGSHGCIRLTNWDAEELATLVEPGVTVSFIE